MKKLLTQTLLSAALLITAAQATTTLTTLASEDVMGERMLVLNLAAPVATHMAEETQPTTPWWENVGSGLYNVGSGLADLGLGLGSTVYTLGKPTIGVGEKILGIADIAIGVSHNAYGTVLGYDAEFMANGTSWANAGWGHLSNGTKNITAGCKNAATTVEYYKAGIPKLWSGGITLGSGLYNGGKALGSGLYNATSSANQFING